MLRTGGERERGATIGDKMSNVAIRKLTKKQTALIDVMVTEGLSPAKAAPLAGYADGKSGYVSANRTLKLPHVQQYLMQRMNEEFGVAATLAVGTVRRLASGAKSEYVQLQASQDLLDRAGYKPIDRSQVQVAGDIRVNIDLS